MGFWGVIAIGLFADADYMLMSFLSELSEEQQLKRLGLVAVD